MQADTTFAMQMTLVVDLYDDNSWHSRKVATRDPGF